MWFGVWFSTDPQVDGGGVFTHPLGELRTGIYESGNYGTKFEPRYSLYEDLPHPGTPLYWQAVCGRSCYPDPNCLEAGSPPRSLTVTLGSRVAPPALEEIGISINHGAIYTNDPHVEISVAAPEFSTEAAIANDGGFGESHHFKVPSNYRATYRWAIASSGPERLPKTAYVRFVGGTPSFLPPGKGVQATQTFTDDIILDETAPVVESVVTMVSRSQNRLNDRRRSRTTRRIHLRIRARDKTSGVSKLQITNRKSKPGPLRRFRGRVAFKSTGRHIYVRARDRAGNFSRWKQGKRR